MKSVIHTLFSGGALRDKMLISFDTEFIDTGAEVALISIGMVRADGRELYLENAEFPSQHGHLVDEWVDDHVMSKTFLRNAPDDPRILPRAEIAERVREFMLDGGQPPSLWAHYAAYDFVALSPKTSREALAFRRGRDRDRFLPPACAGRGHSRG